MKFTQVLLDWHRTGSVKITGNGLVFVFAISVKIILAFAVPISSVDIASRHVIKCPWSVLLKSVLCDIEIIACTRWWLSSAVIKTNGSCLYTGLDARML